MSSPFSQERKTGKYQAQSNDSDEQTSENASRVQTDPAEKHPKGKNGPDPDPPGQDPRRRKLLSISQGLDNRRENRARRRWHAHSSGNHRNNVRPVSLPQFHDCHGGKFRTRKRRCSRRPYDCPGPRQPAPAMPVRGAHKGNSPRSPGIEQRASQIRPQTGVAAIDYLEPIHPIVHQPGNVRQPSGCSRLQRERPLRNPHERVW